MTRDGYLVAEVRAARTGVYDYHGSELGRPDLGTVKVYRPPEEVFSDDALASFTSLPVTIDHPPEMVNAKNWKRYARGYTGEDAAKEDFYVRVPLILRMPGPSRLFRTVRTSSASATPVTSSLLQGRPRTERSMTPSSAIRVEITWPLCLQAGRGATAELVMQTVMISERT